MITIRPVLESDEAFWHTLDPHLSQEQFLRKVRDREGFVLLKDDVPAAILRYSLFWDHIPFCNLLYVAPSFQQTGLGTLLMQGWEEEMRKAGFGMVLVSTQSDETAQVFYRKLGYQDAGGLVMNIPGFEQPLELFLSKAL